MEMSGGLIKPPRMITGYSIEEIRGAVGSRSLSQGPLSQSLEDISKTEKGELPKNFENPILTKSGHERYIVWQNNAVLDQGQIVVPFLSASISPSANS